MQEIEGSSVLLNLEGDPCSNLPEGPFTLLQGLRGLTCISGFPGCLRASPRPKTSPKLCLAAEHQDEPVLLLLLPGN